MTEILIAGAGPSGLMMAICLQRYGIPFRIIDKNIKPIATSNALAVQTRTLEMLDDFGLAQTAIVRGIKLNKFNIYSKDKKIVSLNMQELIDSHFPFILGLSQREMEKLLIEELQKNNIQLELEKEITGLEEQIDGIEVKLRHKNGQTEIINTNYLIACDGGHSIIREKLQLGFEGQELKQHFVMADLPTSPELSPHEVFAYLTPNGPVAAIHYSTEYLRVIAEVTHDPELHAAKSVTPAQLQRLLSEYCPINFNTSNPIWTSGFWIHERLITHYQKNNVFFVGDAAHLHSPVGGQGMNTGMQDAYNLAWKLALVIKGYANKSILTTYESERRPVAKAILAATTGSTRLVTLRNPWLIKLRNFIIHNLMRSIFIRKMLANSITELNLHYKTNELVVDNYKDHGGPQPGTRMLDVNYKGGHLLDAVRGKEFCLLIFTGQQNVVDAAGLTHLQKELQPYLHFLKLIIITSDPEKYASGNSEKILDDQLLIHKRYHAQEPCLYLIRPDKYIGFRNSFQHMQALQQYLKSML